MFHEDYGKSIFAECSEFTYLYWFFVSINKLDGSKQKKNTNNIVYLI